MTRYRQKMSLLLVHLHFGVSGEEEHDHESERLANDDVTHSAVEMQHDHLDCAHVVERVLQIFDDLQLPETHQHVQRSRTRDRT